MDNPFYFCLFCSVCYINHWSSWLSVSYVLNGQGHRESSLALLAFVFLPSEYPIETKEMDCNTLINVNWFASIFTLIFISMVVPIPAYLSCLHFWVSFMDCCQVAPCWKWTLVYNSKFINTVSVNRQIYIRLYLPLPLFVFRHALSLRHMCMYTHTQIYNTLLQSLRGVYANTMCGVTHYVRVTD